MDLVVDANILFASLVKDGKTAELLFRDNFHLYAPEYLFEEFSKHEQLILSKTKRNPQDFKRFIEVISRRIELVSEEEIAPFLLQAKQISPDEGDVPYFALALSLNCGIWSNDFRLQSQARVKIWTTRELAGLAP